MYIYIYIYISIYLSIYIYVCMCIYICMYMYICTFVYDIFNTTTTYYDKQSLYIEQRLFNSKNTVAKCTKWKYMYDCKSRHLIDY